ncbi:hypothetical protein PARHAE_01607 [Paracoccus haematequi]|uniref:Uncharacterized protein n=1 Tax=Paracoccus haematequi TaxID=2491866 RepID=A0A3S4CJ83_9RHOB|nr:hypothetical protein [Paracoccus haematequi]VDS08423.1 hypothetical protein PARHAE_01607 [Paracoccus haematequi]
MSDIRALIREVLAEEIAAIRAELTAGPRQEQVRVATAADLTQFALSVLDRAADPGFAAALRGGGLHFVPMATPAPGPAPTAQPAVLVTTVPAPVPELAKSLITERDIAAIAEGETRLRVGKRSRLTPLAGDEARRRGIRIERNAT